MAETPMSEADRAARCAWICYVQARLDGDGAEVLFELASETKTTLWALDGAARAAHLSWRDDVRARLELALHDFCPGGGDCCDEVFWPKAGQGAKP